MSTRWFEDASITILTYCLRVSLSLLDYLFVTLHCGLFARFECGHEVINHPLSNLSISLISHLPIVIFICFAEIYAFVDCQIESLSVVCGELANLLFNCFRVRCLTSEFTHLEVMRLLTYIPSAFGVGVSNVSASQT